MRTNSDGLSLIEIFKSEFDPAESKTAAENLIRIKVKRRLTNNQFSALVSLVMSEGREVLYDMLPLLNSEDPEKRIRAAEKFDKYIYAESAEERYADQFLIYHRAREKELFLRPEILPKRKKK